MWPVVISIAFHSLLFGAFTFGPLLLGLLNWRSDAPMLQPFINVQMVDLSDLGASPAPKKKESVSKEKAPVVQKKEQPPKKTSTKKEKSTQKAEVSLAKPKKKMKKALKYKTYKAKKVLKNTLKRVEKNVKTQPLKPMEDTIKRLQEKVAKEGRPGPLVENPSKKRGEGKSGIYGRGTRKEMELIDMYRLEIAYTINKNWAFAEQLSGSQNKLMASIVFKVMPNGNIEDIFFTDHSGNQYLDDSAYKAIVKSSPVKPHPSKLNREYVEVGLRFTPEGVQ